MENSLVIKSNKLIEARYKLSLNEQKIILYSVSKLDREKEKFNVLELKLNEFTELIGTTKDRYTELREIVRGLRKKEIIINSDNGELITGWLSSINYIKDSSIIELEFSEKLAPYLLQLKEQFTRYQLKNILHLKNKYSIRVYELLKQYENIGKRKLTLEELKMFLIIDDKYSDFRNLKRLVLDKTIQEINQYTDLEVSYEKVKRGRRVVAIEYFIENKEEKTNKQLEALYNIPQLKRDCGLDSEDWSSKQIIELYEIAVDKAEDIDVYEYIKINYKKMLENRSARNKFAYLKKSLEEDFAKAYNQIKYKFLI